MGAIVVLHYKVLEVNNEKSSHVIDKPFIQSLWLTWNGIQKKFPYGRFKLLKTSQRSIQIHSIYHQLAKTMRRDFFLKEDPSPKKGHAQKHKSSPPCLTTTNNRATRRAQIENHENKGHQKNRKWPREDKGQHSWTRERNGRVNKKEGIQGQNMRTWQPKEAFRASRFEGYLVMGNEGNDTKVLKQIGPWNLVKS